MRKLPLISITFLGLALTFGLAACDGGDDVDVGTDETETGGETDTGDGDGDGGCFDAPPECLQFVECIGAVAPTQSEMVAAKYGADGSCWCGDEAAAQECYETCVEEVAKAIDGQPTVSACHENSCGIDELDPAEPYGPVVDGACPQWDPGQGTVYDQIPVEAPFGLPGSVCAPPCTGIANVCPEHPQTAATGACFISFGGEDYCVARCYVDPDAVGGTQCQCGATCQPYGPADPDGNMRGICTFE